MMRKDVRRIAYCVGVFVALLLFTACQPDETELELSTAVPVTVISQSVNTPPPIPTTQPLPTTTPPPTAVSLTPTENKLLYILVRNAGRIVTTDFLLNRIWPMQDAQEDRLHVHIHRLRRKIEADHNEPTYIIAERGTGYRFNVKPER